MSAKLTVGECQSLVERMMNEHGWQKRSMPMLAMFMAEELGEVCKAVGNLEIKGKTPERVQELALELADVFNYCCCLSTKYGIDLGAAFKQKIDINSKRVW